MTIPQHAGHRSAFPVDPMPPEIVRLRRAAAPLWIFAYGSLMWNLEIAFAETRPTILYGYHRSFCLYSRDYRGTPQKPGLVLGLDRGGSCRGIACRLPADRPGETLDLLWAREMTGRVYQMRPVAPRTAAGALAAWAFVVRRDSPDYAGRLALDEMARLLATASGGRGSGRDYLVRTIDRLDALGIRDRLLQRIAARIGEPAAPPPPAKS